MPRALLVLAVLLGLSVGAPAQDLGQAAEKEKARRQKIQGSGGQTKSYTDSDLRKSDIPHPAPESATEANAASGSATGNGASALAAAAGTKVEPAEKGGPSEKLSDIELLHQKIDSWRAKYRTAKAEVDALETKVADLTARTQPGAPQGIIITGNGVQPPSAVPESELLSHLLEEARKDLAKAKQRLEEIIESARRDGVGYGQLY